MGSESRTLLLEAFELISSTTVLGAFYGIVFSLYCLCARSLYRKLKVPSKQRSARFSFGFISFLFLCTTGYLSMCAVIIRLAYINHADFPGGPYVYESSYGSILNAYGSARGILGFFIDGLTMAIQIWRLWMIWGGTRWAVVVTILPVLLLLAFIGLYIPLYIVNVTVSLNIPNGTLVTTEVATCIVASVFTALVTGLIAVRILYVRRQLGKLMGASGTEASPYLTIVAMLVESYVLEAAWSLAAAVTHALDDVSYGLFVSNDPVVKIIAYFLIIYRVENGRGWTKQVQEEVTTLRWNSGGQSTTDETSSTVSQVPQTTIKPMKGVLQFYVGRSDSTV